ncbi:HET-domain-containing protein [Lepidopterella palustris CBS 459.81]|uniref:HET-domain-containing protein n=1 Tax=Lepidopterella palustris CBS 459.81 TaxID=1314670 RepID=A0A8E2EDQ9_9PEZI|nr:HET-domain-containing protein [Lepidopterella palustris CBS 459.81]
MAGLGDRFVEESEPDAIAGALPDDGRERRLNADSRGLREKIKNILINNPIGLNPEGHYLPDDEYNTLFTRDTIQSALGGGYVNRQLVEYVLKDAKRTFATLLLVFADCESRRNAIDALRANNFTDNELSSLALELCPCRPNGQTCGHSFPYYNPWDSTYLDSFKLERWHFLVPTFETDTFLYEFDKDRLLPFTTKVPAGNMPSGHFSDVTCVEMLASKQDKVNVPGNTIIVALKTLKRINDRDYNIDREWRREAKAHKQLNGKSSNIIQAFAAYRQIAAHPQNDTYHLVLEWADGGSLLDFWENNRLPQVHHKRVKESRQRVKEMLEQLYGLADALEGMHSTSAQSPGHSRRSSVRSSPTLSPERGVHRRGNSLESGVPLADSSSLPTFNIEDADDARPDDAVVFNVSVSPPGPASLEAIAPSNLTRRTTGFNSENWRHGDIKPENILRFTNGKANAYLGVLKLADLGRAQQHLFVTRMRETKEQELWRTRWYEPPDLEEQNHKQAQEKISRLFDIWSMGCVIFEAVLWLLYGSDSFEVFLRANKLTTGEPGATPYWRKGERGEYELSDAATRWMNHILDHDPERNGAVGHLVKLVRDRLLKIRLPPNSDIYTEGFRTNAKDLKEQFALIISNAEGDERYLFSGADRANASLPEPVEPSTNISPQSTGRSSLSPDDAARMSLPVARGRRTAIAQQREYTNRMEDKWKTLADNDFAESNLAGRNFRPNAPELCPSCEIIDISSPQISFDMDTLKTNSDDEECDLCELVYTAAKDLDLRGRNSILLTRLANSFVLDGTNMKVLRLCRTKSATEQDAAIPIGAPALVTPGSRDPSAESLDSFTKLPKAWLQECDLKHGHVCAPRPSSQVLPIRLISVENPKKPKIIVTTELALDPKKTDYVALSHKWGKMPDEAVTTRQNIEQRKKKIPVNELPLSFKNAIAITRALDCTYLWIDSLCILQGPDGDFNEQADKMQTTFSGAYCVLAACSAESATDGFLQDRESRYVKKGDIFVSAVTNDFERDVLHSPLNCRGWVLQERALARRTIFFTNTQMYWECGDGIRCETLAKLKNDKIAFLGDANFPDYTIRPTSTVGEQIDLFIDLFQRYTRLEFSYPEDRPIAIDGLMERLTHAFKTRSLAGLFETFWGRCLLWRRADGAEPLKKIPRGTHTLKIPPTWSWMAFNGVISFIEPEGGQVNWNDHDIILPFADRTQASWLRTSHRGDSVAIRAKAFDFEIAVGASESEAFISYDGDNVSTSASTKCVIIGSEKQQVSDAGTRIHYVLIVKATSDAPGTTSYERVGVGYLLGKFVLLNRPSVPVTIE